MVSFKVIREELVSLGDTELLCHHLCMPGDRQTCSRCRSPLMSVVVSILQQVTWAVCGETTWILLLNSWQLFSKVSLYFHFFLITNTTVAE